jgi:hypothetical protein
LPIPIQNSVLKMSVRWNECVQQINKWKKNRWMKGIKTDNKWWKYIVTRKMRRYAFFMWEIKKTEFFWQLYILWRKFVYICNTDSSYMKTSRKGFLISICFPQRACSGGFSMDKSVDNECNLFFLWTSH